MILSNLAPAANGWGFSFAKLISFEPVSFAWLVGVPVTTLRWRPGAQALARGGPNFPPPGSSKIPRNDQAEHYGQDYQKPRIIYVYPMHYALPQRANIHVFGPYCSGHCDSTRARCRIVSLTRGRCLMARSKIMRAKSSLAWCFLIFRRTLLKCLRLRLGQ
jgi:hypothetical protein